MKSCAYCGREWQERENACAHCGAPVRWAKIEKWEPFFCEGYIVYELRDYSRRIFSYIFYKGITLIGRVDVPDEEMEKWSPTLDPMPTILERLNQSVTIPDRN